MNKGSISDWKIVQDKKNLKTKLVNTNKFEDYQRIKDFNLPHFKDYFVDYTNFNKKNKSLMFS